MNITQESVSDFAVGHGGADAGAGPLVAAGFAPKAYKGVRVRAATANTLVIYVGPRGVTEASGYPLPAGKELSIEIENPSKVHVVATPAADAQQQAVLSGQTGGDTFDLTFRGQTASGIAVTANAAAVQTALRALSTIGSTGCSVTDTAGGPPYTVTFIGPLARTDVELLVATPHGATLVVTVTKTNDITAGSRYSWIAV